jgi:hypothetical protein
MNERKDRSERLIGLSPAKQALLEKRLRGRSKSKGRDEGVSVRREGELLPLSFAQQRLWLLDQLEPGNAIYNVPVTMQLRGEVRVDVLERTLSEIVRRHEVLRTTFATVDGSPVQVVKEAREGVRLETEDLRALPATERESRAKEMAQAEARQPFNLSEAPLLRARLLRLGEEDYVVLLTMHHIASDGWSIGVLLQELAAIYQAYVEGRPSPLAELPAQYADFAVWQREWLQGGVLERELDFWKQYLGGRLPVLELKADRPRLAARSYRGAGVVMEIPATVTEELRGLARREGATLYMTLLAAYKILLRHYSGEDDIIVGSPINIRRSAKFEGLIGFFINSLVLRTDLAGDPDFAELIGRVREGALGAYSHANVPFEKLVEELQPERSKSHTPIFQVWMNLENDSAFEVKLPGVTFSAFRLEKESAKFDLALLARERAEMIECMFEYNTDLFDESTVSRFAGTFDTILRKVTAEPHLKLSALKQALDEQERQSRLIEERVYENSVRQRLKGLRRRSAE